MERAARSTDSDHPSPAPLHVFGLTGGIACGKSTVARHWRKRGLAVVDADLLAHQAVAPGSPCLAAIVRRFGEHVLLPDGSLNRQEFGAHVFADPAALRELSALVHPQVRELAKIEFEALGRGGTRLACYEVPLLFEAGLDQQYRPVVVVAAPEQLQVARLMQQRGLTREQAHARLASQLPMAEKVRRADFVIDGSGEIDETRRQADRVLTRVAAQLGLADALPRDAQTRAAIGLITATSTDPGARHPLPQRVGSLSAAHSLVPQAVEVGVTIDVAAELAA